MFWVSVTTRIDPFAKCKIPAYFVWYMYRGIHTEALLSKEVVIVQDQSFEQVLERYTPLIKGQIKKLHLTKQYEDYFQIGVIALWDAYRHFDATKGSFSAYALHTVRGRMLTALQEERRFNERHVLQDEQTSLIFQHAISNNIVEPYLEELEVELSLGALSSRERLWVKEAIILGKKRGEIANEQKVSTNTVSSWRKSALKKLRERRISLKQ